MLSTTIDFVDGLARVFNDFGVDLFDALFTKIDSNLEGKITYEEVRDVLGLVNVINNEVVIMDDLFIDLNSQLGFGFEDGIVYNGFKRYIKIFGETDYTENRAIPTQPGIVHNLEIMNETYMNNIANSLVFGTPISTIVELFDDFNGSYLFNLGKVFSFTPTYKGTRKFAANGCTIKLYQYDENDCLQAIETAQNSLTYEYDKTARYLLIVEANSRNNMGISFSIEDKMGLGDNTVEVGSGDERIYKLTSSVSGYYLISVSNTKISLSGATYIASGRYYVYLKANTSKYIYLTNSEAYSITVNIEVYDPNEIDLNQAIQITNSNQKVMKFTNPYNSSMAYKLDISWSSGAKYASVYNSDGSNIGSVTTSGTNKTYSFTLSDRQTCYVIYSNTDTDSSITSNLYINPTQLRWRIDGTLYDTDRIQLPRGDSYTIELVVLYNETIVDYTSPYVNTTSTNFVFSDNKLSIDKKALIGYDITIYPTLAPDYLLTVQIGYGNEFSWYVSNSDIIILSWNVNETFDKINFTITNKNGTYRLSKSTTNFDITSYLPISLGTTTIELNSVVINGITFNNGTKFLNVSGMTLNNLFAGGSGDNDDPYLITNERELNNIRYATRCSYEYEVCLEIISANFKLMNSITLKNAWIPIEYNFRGNFDGNYETISNLQISALTSGKNYGFFETVNYGTVKNLYFDVIEISGNTNNNEDTILVGAVAGYNYFGHIENCDVNSGEIKVYTYNAWLGGVVGYNCGGRVNDSDNWGVEIYGYGILGGIVGINSTEGKVDYCWNEADIYYYYNTGNGSVGGIVGKNLFASEVTNCQNKGKINYASASSNNTSIAPHMGQIIGWMVDGVQSDNIYAGDTDYSKLKTSVGGFLGIGAKNQRKYCSTKEVGRTSE